MTAESHFRTLRVIIALLILSAAGRAAALPRIVKAVPEKSVVGRWEKFELRVSLSADFFNPYDPEQVDLKAEFTSPSGRKWLINGFFNPVQWDLHWMVRFAPDEAGPWRFDLRVKDSGGRSPVYSGTFEVTESDRRGMVGIAPNNRYLAYRDGTSFYGVGLWYNDNDIWWGGDSELISESGLDRLKENGANSITLFWRPLESLSAGPGRYDPKLSDRLDEIFGWCEARGIHIAWNLWFHSFLSQTVWSGWDSIWDTHAYSKITRALDFYADSTAWAYQKKLYRYIIARWGYSTSLYLWFVIDEIDGTEGWGKGDTLAAQNWGRNVRDFFRANDPWQRPTTGTKCGHVDRYWPGGCEIFDVAAREIYESQGWPMPDPTQLDNGKADPLKCSYNNYAGEIRKMWGSYAKPLIIGESGWNSTFYKPGTPGYLATYHNALWVSLASGLAATPFWWEYFDFINEQVVTSQMKYFARFVSDIDLAGRHWLPAKVQADGGADAFGMQSGDQAFGWVVNPDKSLYRASISISGLADGKYEVRIYNPWNGEYIEPQKMTCSGGRLTVTIPEMKDARGRVTDTGHDVSFIARKKE